MTKRVGMIGTGNMGNPMCRNMLKAGLDVRVFDVDPSRVEALREFGATGAGSIAELVQQVDYVMLSLPELRIIELVVLGEGGVLASSR
ncbi:MAG: NAD(P)-binding domain-containing protein, partial [Chloroflexi bacterium]|nr:NAD(P)-binding domain-containing protein [Chloroflexota bacterium]